MRNGKLDSQPERSLVELVLRIDANVPQQEHTIKIGVVYDSFPDLQVLVVWIGRLVGRPSDMLSETDMPRSAETDLTEPFRALLNRAMLIVLKRQSRCGEVSDFDKIRQDSKHLG